MKQFLQFLSLRPENESGMNRQCIGNGPAKLHTLFAMLLMLFSFSVGNAWGADPQIDLRGKTSALTLPKANSATSYSAGDWRIMAPNATNKSATGTVTQSSVTYGTIYFYLTGDANTTTSSGYPLQFTKSTGYLTTTILSDYGVDITVRWKSKTSGKVEMSLTGASTVYSDATSWQTKQISTTNTSATLRIGSKSGATDASGVEYITITPKTGSCTATPSIGAASLNGSFNLNH